MGKRKRDRKPVLTSPWKIGTLVALMLTATSFGVGYYMVRIYNIDLYWLSSDVSKWGVDSYQFFREIYPAAAGVMLLALFTYFVIASAVRRYKYYLNSGQDYRKMISLAESIDDLTNPAQIARLSEYPELQEVLRNYGDQIREISEGMETREEEMRSVDLEVEIDSILQGNGMNETLAEGKWWATIARKIHVWIEENDGGSDDMKKQSEAARQAAGRASLSCGKVAETAAGAGEDILDIVRSVGQLNAVATSLGFGTVQAEGSPSGSVSAMETAAATLEERGAAIHDLSEESNGLALNMALMAARGEATEKDLAELAEKVRSSAERYGKLGRELEGLARTISDNSRKVESASGTTAVSPDAGNGVMEISEKIESRSRALQQKMTSMGNDVEEIKRALQSVNEEEEEERIRATDGSIVNFGSESERQDEEPDGIDDSNLVIDHGKLWEGPEEEPVSVEEDAVKSEDTGESGDLLISGFQEAMGAMQTDSEEPVENSAPVDEPVVEEIDQPEQIAEETHEEIIEETIEETIEESMVSEQVQVEESADVVGEIFADEPAADGNWDDMQVAAEVEPEPQVASEPVNEMPLVEPEIVQEPQAHEPAPVVEQVAPETDEEPVYDLFELGAVEYQEETEVNL